MLLLLISLIAGILTILAPCVLPLLPVIIGGSIGGNKKDKARPYIIGASLAISVILFTLLLKVSTVLVSLSPNVLDWLSGGLLVILGLVSTLPELWEKFVIALNWQAASQRFLGRGERNKSKYGGPVLIGIALGPVFASCSPTYAFILASVLPFTFLAGLIYLVAYTAGLALALLAVSLAGRKLINRFSWAVNTHSLFRRSLGVLFIVIGVGIIGGYQIKVETWVANHLPFDEAKVEQVLLAKQHKSSIIHNISEAISGDDVLNVQPTPAPQFVGLTNWINSEPLTLSRLKGKVVLVDFWTFSCINCIRTLPYLEKWYQTYSSKGLVIIGVNTPEFAFEHDPANVRAAVIKDGIKYPVALDNNYDTWNAYSNDSWPADYLIDKQGDLRYVSLGEGDYSKTEKAIQDLLGINAPLTTPTSNVPISETQTPETYFGTNRADAYDGATPLNNGTANYTATPAASLSDNAFTLGGEWTISGQSITSESDSSTLTENVSAKDVYMVASAVSNSNETLMVSLPTNVTDEYGTDAPNGQVMVNADRLYHIVSLKKFGTIDVTVQVPQGVSLYTFTFGS
ncbi:MAG TPA: redoxin family protein [Candidatus Binatia bacterium]|nr:redoxin family protein [Candidatus Binatia bacterium]